MGLAQSIAGSSAGAASFATFTADLSQAAATYDLCTATGGDIWIDKIVLVVTVAGATFTTVSFGTNDTTALSLLAATAAATLAAGLSVPTTWTQVTPQVLRSTKKIQYTIIGLTGTGTIKVYVSYRPCATGASLV